VLASAWSERRSLGRRVKQPSVYTTFPRARRAVGAGKLQTYVRRHGKQPLLQAAYRRETLMACLDFAERSDLAQWGTTQGAPADLPRLMLWSSPMDQRTISGSQESAHLAATPRRSGAAVLAPGRYSLRAKCAQEGNARCRFAGAFTGATGLEPATSGVTGQFSQDDG
jgi:hypothetical protein